MLEGSFEKMSNGMRWALIIPTAILILTLSAVLTVITFSSLNAMPHATTIVLKAGSIETAATMNELEIRAQDISNFLDQQLMHTNKRMGIMAEKIKKETNPKAITGMSEGVAAMKIETAQIGEQQKNIKTLIDELNQLKRELKNSPITNKA